MSNCPVSAYINAGFDDHHTVKPVDTAALIKLLAERVPLPGTGPDRALR